MGRRIRGNSLLPAGASMLASVLNGDFISLHRALV